MDNFPNGRDDTGQFYMAFTHAVLFWNDLEQSARQLLIIMSGNGLGAFAAITHLGNTALPEALLAVTEHLGDAEIEEAIKHFVKCMERLRAYRNYYVHAADTLGAVMTADGPKNVCFLSTWSAKGKIVEHADYVTTEQMWDIGHQFAAVSIYGNMIGLRLERHIKGETPDGPFPSLNKPPLPSQLKKTQRKLQPLPDQLPASRKSGSTDQ